MEQLTPGPERQNKDTAKSQAVDYYQDAYYAAYAAKNPKVDPENPFGYKPGQDGCIEVESFGEKYKIQSEADFLEIRRLADGKEGWTLRNEDKVSMKKIAGIDGTIFVWDKPPPDRRITNFNMAKVFAVIPDLPPWLLYDTLHDCVYRWEWDENMEFGYNICNLDLHNDIGYYGAKSPSWIVAKRDFCNQRAWRNIDGREFIIMNRSRPHVRCPEKKKEGVVRAISILSGYFVRPWGQRGCTITYVALTDLKGSIPAGLINTFITTAVPKTIANMVKVGRKYQIWKSGQVHAKHRPWVVPPDPWSKPQVNELYEEIEKITKGALREPDEKAPAAPQEWYDGCPAMLWYQPGCPLHGKNKLAKRASKELSRRGAQNGSSKSLDGGVSRTPLSESRLTTHAARPPSASAIAHSADGFETCHSEALTDQGCELDDRPNPDSPPAFSPSPERGAPNGAAAFYGAGPAAPPADDARRDADDRARADVANHAPAVCRMFLGSTVSIWQLVTGGFYKDEYRGPNGRWMGCENGDQLAEWFIIMGALGVVQAFYWVLPLMCSYAFGDRFTQKMEEGRSQRMQLLWYGAWLFGIVFFAIWVWGNVEVWRAKKGDGCKILVTTQIDGRVVSNEHSDCSGCGELQRIGIIYLIVTYCVIGVIVLKKVCERVTGRPGAYPRTSEAYA